MEACSGTLVVEEDGTPLWCSEESHGRLCGGRAYERHRIFLSRNVSDAAPADRPALPAVDTNN